MKNKISHITKTLYRGRKLLLADLENFINKLEVFRAKIDENESEEHNKYILRDLLKNTFYAKNKVNTNGRFDFTIENDHKIDLIIECKAPKSNEMITEHNFETKSMAQILLYYLQERVINHNNDLKRLVVSNFYQWFIFDAQDFEKLFFENKNLKKEFQDWHSNQKTSSNTALFYKEIAPKYIKGIQKELPFVCIDIENTNTNLDENSEELIALYKLFSPEFLLKKPFQNDANSLDTEFYFELLHIIGLEEVDDKNKKLIKRKKKGDRQEASLIESAIRTISVEINLEKIKDVEEYGENQEEQIENIALELAILWVNRIIFLKLLEAQLFSYNNKNDDFKFLDLKTISGYGELNELFFEVLAQEKPDRAEYLADKFKKIPYLNSSLFEISNLEKQTIRINSLKEHLKLPLFEKSVLKKQKEMGGLAYFFKFLDAFDFTSTSTEEVQKERKNLINAAVLGLIFEKINGYKEGAFFTPSAITMYMCRETITKAVLQKFQEAGYKIKTSDSLFELKDLIEDRKEANKIMNSLKICDPSVGSGHFLVSVLNEIIYIKYQLGILQYRNGHKIRDFKVEIIDDELIITDKDTDTIFEYLLNEKNKPIDYKQELQEALFHEKQNIIENCLFGVDINPNSVSITCLRLWIELLKNAFYTQESGYEDLETLPNIDINIKKGNSLISKFALNGKGRANGQAKKMRIATEKYKRQVIIYKSTDDKKTKRNAETEITRIKEEFAQNVNPNDKDYVILKEKKSKLGEMPIFFSQEDKDKWLKKTKELIAEVAVLEEDYNQKLKTIYGKAFEWRFEFPEVLDVDGNFEGFDVVIGNPPYISAVDMARNNLLKEYNKSQYPLATGAYDIFILFLIKARHLLKKGGLYSWIIPNKFLSAQYAEALKEELINEGLLKSVDISHIKIFANASVYPILIFGENIKKENTFRRFYAENEIDLEKNNLIEYQKLRAYSSFKELGIKIMSGTTGFEAAKIKNLLSERKTKNSIPFIVSGCIDQYLVDYKNLRFMGNKYKQAYINNNKNKIAESKWNFWNKKKIIIAGMTKKVEAIWKEEPTAIGVGTYGIYDFADFEPKFLLALLNSTFLSFYVNHKFRDKHLAGGYLSINKNTIEKYPLVKASKAIQFEFVKLVDKILNLKQANPKADTSELEQEIDGLVYKLYDLSEAEIKIIEDGTTRFV